MFAPAGCGLGTDIYRLLSVTVRGHP